MVDIPDIPLENFEAPEEREEQVEDSARGSLTFGIIGSGQAGGRLAKAFYDLGYHKTLAINTATHDLELLDLPEEHKFHAKPEDKDGAGKNMAVAKEIVNSYKQEIADKMRNLFGHKVDHVMISAGGGGGTGCGSIAILVDLAKRYLDDIGVENVDKKVGVVLTLPQKGEAKSPIVASNTAEVVEALKVQSVAPVLIVDNQKIEEMYRGIPPKAYWSAINMSIATLFDVFNKLSNHSSEYTSFDPADYASVVRHPGCMVMGVTRIKEVNGETDISKAVKENLFRSLLAEGFDFKKAKVAACIAIGGKEMMANTAGLMDWINYGFDQLANITGETMIHRGIYEGSNESLRIFTLIGGLEYPEDRLKVFKKNSKIDPLYGEKI